MHERTEIWNFSRGVQLGISKVSTANEWYTRREIPYLQVTTYYFGFLFERLVITRSRLLQKGTRCLSHMALNIVSDLRAADFSRVEYFFLSGGNPYGSFSIWWRGKILLHVRYSFWWKIDVVSQTTSLNLEISRCHLADYVKELYQSACRTCSTIIFTHSTNQIIVFWRRRCSCRRPCSKLRKLPEVVFRGRSVETLGLGS